MLAGDKTFIVAHLAFAAQSQEHADALLAARPHWKPRSPVPVQDRLSVSYRCSNAGCVNPQHQCLESMKDNYSRANCQVYGIYQTPDGKVFWECPHNPPCLMVQKPKSTRAARFLDVDPAWALQEPEEPDFHTVRSNVTVARMGGAQI